MNTKVLVIDDDKFIQKVVAKAIGSDGFEVTSALNGEIGFEKARAEQPDIILLDVEMPGLNGYQVCEQLRSCDETKDIAVVFLSSQSSLRERLQGYEVGADDYLAKPFEAAHLLARLKVLRRYQQERRDVQAQYQLARNTALLALTGTSEASIAMQFMERSIACTTNDETIQALLDVADLFNIDCCVCIEQSNGENAWYASDGTVSPLEKELVEMSDHSLRYLDFGCRTVVHCSPVSLLVKNMPLEAPDRYGRLKDLLPVLLSTVNTKLKSISTYNALVEQSKDLSVSFQTIRKELFELASLIVSNRSKVSVLSSTATHNLTLKLVGLGLEDDQEENLIQLLETVLAETLNTVDVGTQLRHSFKHILDSLSETMSKHDELLAAFIANQQQTNATSQSFDDGVELF